MRLRVVHKPYGAVLPDHLFGKAPYARIARSERNPALFVGIVAETFPAHVETGADKDLAGYHRRGGDGDVALGFVALHDFGLFAERLERRGLTATVRRRLGSDVNAACGQLRRAHADKGES